MFEPPACNNEDMSNFDKFAYSIINFGLALFYLVIVVCAIVMFLRRYSRVFPFYKSSWIFLVLLCALAILHLGFLSLRTINLFWVHLCIPSTFVFLFDVLPGLLMYATFIALLVFWGDIYVGSYEHKPETTTLLNSESPSPSFISVAKVRMLIMGIVSFIVLSMFALLIAFASVNGMQCRANQPVLEPLVVYGIGFIYFTSIPIATVIGFFGYKIYKTVVEDKGLTATNYSVKIAILRKYAFVTFFCVFCFTMRGFMLILEWHRVFKKDYWADGSYYLFLDLLPLCFMVALLLQPPFRPTSNFATMNLMGLY